MQRWVRKFCTSCLNIFVPILQNFCSEFQKKLFEFSKGLFRKISPHPPGRIRTKSAPNLKPDRQLLDFEDGWRGQGEKGEVPSVSKTTVLEWMQWSDALSYLEKMQWSDALSYLEQKQWSDALSYLELMQWSDALSYLEKMQWSDALSYLEWMQWSDALSFHLCCQQVWELESLFSGIRIFLIWISIRICTD